MRGSNFNQQKRQFTSLTLGSGYAAARSWQDHVAAQSAQDHAVQDHAVQDHTIRSVQLTDYNPTSAKPFGSSALRERSGTSDKTEKMVRKMVRQCKTYQTSENTSQVRRKRLLVHIPNLKAMRETPRPVPLAGSTVSMGSIVERKMVSLRGSKAKSCDGFERAYPQQATCRQKLSMIDELYASPLLDNSSFARWLKTPLPHVFGRLHESKNAYQCSSLRRVQDCYSRGQATSRVGS